MKTNKLKEIRKDLSSIKEKYDAVVFGSNIENANRPDSDIDVAILSYKSNENENLSIQKELLGQFPSIYDIRVFELFPIYIKINIIHHYIVLFGDPLEISEYFYKFRKQWDDCKHRIMSNQFSHYRERLTLLKE